MGEQHLTQVGIQRLLALLHGDADIAQAQAHQLAGPCLDRFDGGEHRAAGRDGMAQGFRHAVTVARGAGQGAGQSTGGDDDPVAVDDAAVHQFHTGDCAVRGQDVLHARTVDDAYAGLPHELLQSSGHVGSLLRGREDASSALDDHGTAAVLQQLHHVLRAKVGQGRIQEARVARHLPHELVQRAVVGHIAAALTGDVHLLAELLVALQQRDTPAGTGREDRRHHTRCAAADDDDIMHDCLPLPGRPRRSPRWIPAGGSAPSGPPCGAGPGPPAMR